MPSIAVPAASDSEAQGRPQVVSDRVGHMTHTVHQMTDAVEHPVDVDAQAPEFVLARNRNALGQIARLDSRGRATDLADAFLDLMAKQQRSENQHQDGGTGTGHQRLEHEIADRPLLAQVPADIQKSAIGQLLHDQAAHGALAFPDDFVRDDLAERPRGRRHRGQIADHALPRRRYHQEHFRIAVDAVVQLQLDLLCQLFDRPVLERIDQAIGDRRDLAVDTAIHHTDGAEVEHTRRDQDRFGHQHREPERKPGGDRFRELSHGD
jgi:hypothetical protein